MTQNSKSPAQPILLVEDSEDDYYATTRAFTKASLLNPVIWVKSGDDALHYLRKDGSYAPDGMWKKPGLVLLDLNMPGLDGRGVLKRIKEDEGLKSIPVVILTTSSDEKDVEACYEMGASTYIQKPVSFEGLIEAVKGLKEYWFEIALLPKEEDDAA